MPVLISALVLVSAGLVAVSPLALDAFGDSEAWNLRSAIGQTYGAAAALLAVLALAGISVSLILQAREAKIAREYASRSVHTELLRMAMDDLAYRECWGPLDPSRDQTSTRQHMYVNLILSYWQSRFEIGMFSEPHLRLGASSMFSARPGREFWLAAREARFAVSHTRRLRRFHQILDEEYQKAELREPPAEPAASPVETAGGLRSRLAKQIHRLAERVEARGSTG